MFGSRNTIGATSIPATAPIDAASPQPNASIQDTRTPINRAEDAFLRRRPHRQSQGGVTKEHRQNAKHDQGHGDDTDLLDADQAVTENIAWRKRVTGIA